MNFGEKYILNENMFNIKNYDKHEYLKIRFLSNFKINLKNILFRKSKLTSKQKQKFK